MPAPTLRTLAKSLGLSRTTVSEALRGSSCVKPATAERIRLAAKAAGYQPNPLAGAVMSELRRSRGNAFRGVLAAVALTESDRPLHAGPFFRELLRGATERATALGFKIELFTAGGDTGVSLSRLNQILQSRGIQGLILMPVWGDPDFTALDWDRYAGVYADYMIERPALHSICPDHHRSITGALQQVTARGYRRPGMFVQRHHDERLQYRWQAAFLAFQQNSPDCGQVPLLISDDINEKSFTAWFKKYQPDIVLGHNTQAIEWMKACGANIPKTHGFVSLNVIHAHMPCAGLDQQPAHIGLRAAEILVAKLHRNERGAPQPASLTTIPARWIDGPTVREKVNGHTDTRQRAEPALA
jgi:DNA-binding LacI/PurR family transcriptional regulator